MASRFSGSLKSLWQKISHVATALSVIGWFPWRSLLVGGIGLTPAGLAVDELPLWAVGLVALAGILLVVCVLVGLMAILNRLKPSKVPGHQVEAPDAQEPVRRLLTEAAEGLVARKPEKYGDIDAAVTLGWHHGQILDFLARAFVEPRDRALRDYLGAEQRRLDPNDFDRADATARFLRRLAESIDDDDMHPGFVIPITFEQFANQKEWPRNVTGHGG